MLRCSAKVYPHVCGAAASVLNTDDPILGLSPRVRGSLTSVAGVFWAIRSIPACAGQPCHSRTVLQGRQVYPRVCGVAEWVNVAVLVGLGLSPRVRGSLPLTAASVPPMGSIPTCAGQPIGVRLVSNHQRVYPHVCGAAAVLASLVYRCGGLSPRVRGSRPTHTDPNATCRSIPTCAGQPVAGR